MAGDSRNGYLLSVLHWIPHSCEAQKGSDRGDTVRSRDACRTCADRGDISEGATEARAMTDVVTVSGLMVASWAPFEVGGGLPPLDSTLRRYQPYPDLGS